MPPAPPMSRDRRLVWILGSALILVTVLLLLSLSRPTAPPGATQTTPPNNTTSDSGEHAAEEVPEIPDFSRRIDGDPTAIGDVDAPVVLIEYADYRCPYCGVYARDTLPTIIQDYVDAGQVRVEWRDVPIFGDESFDTAVAARAAGEQGLFWEYSNAVFAYDGSGRQDLPRERLVEIATEIGVPDITAFTAALDSPALIDLVTADLQEAQSIGVQSTPTFIVGQTPIMGAQPLEAFRQVIEAELERAGL